MMRTLLTFLTPLLAAALLQAPAKPPMKMGLWEENSTLKVPQPNGTDKTTSRVVRSCITPANWLELMGPTAQGACPKTNEVWSNGDYSFDVACTGKPKEASVEVHFSDPESQYGSVDVYTSPEGAPAKMHGKFEGHWVSADCGDVSPDHPVLVR